jgi:hypothetical protein
MMNDVIPAHDAAFPQGYGCSQMLMRLFLEARGEDNPAPGPRHGRAGIRLRRRPGHLRHPDRRLLRFGALCRRGRTEAGASERLPLMLQEFSDWFEERVGGPRRDHLRGHRGRGGPGGRPPAMRGHRGRHPCPVLEILAANGFDPSGGSLDP